LVAVQVVTLWVWAGLGWALVEAFCASKSNQFKHYTAGD